MFDATVQMIGEQRLPQTRNNPEIHQRNDFSQAYSTLNVQGTRMLGEDIEIYLGAENLFDFRQRDAIVSNADPFGPYFDSNFAYAPVFGRNIYIGFRYTIPNEDQKGVKEGH